ncbi:hypothetical protein HNY73_001247 [Argiope bruennichi]|uniref:Uncharacterized protein n=1 Tax=Argiope bruennichi TaxID=94029 RepID=A0A8T0G4X4_ARGBR|nr:hypothetical protein HNY73_001247 [Argiope bruennichi]
MYFSFMPSLLHMSSVRVVSRLLLDRDIGILLDEDMSIPSGINRYERRRHEVWKAIEKKARRKLRPLQTRLSIKLVKFLRPMYMEVIAWLRDHEFEATPKIFNFLLKHFIQWKTDGTIDRKKTAMKMIQSRRFHYRYRFILACNYLLIDDIFVLWNRVKRSKRKKLYRTGTNAAVRFWVHLLKAMDGASKAELIQKYFSASSEDRAGPSKPLISRYFKPKRIKDTDFPLRLSSYFPFIPQEYRQEYFTKINYALLNKTDFSLCLYEMHEQERLQLLEAKPAFALKRCLEWPFQSLFVELAKQVVDHMKLIDYELMLRHIIVFYILSDLDYYELFSDFWDVIPENYRNRIMEVERSFFPFKAVLNFDGVNPSKTIIKTLKKYYYS